MRASQDAAAVEQRARMVAEQLAERDIADARVLAAMRKVPRHEFVPAELARHAYDDAPLPIGSGQTISQPYVVAMMCELARVVPTSRVLEIGTGCGYQAAVLAELCAEVYSIEIVPDLAARAAETLAQLGYQRIHLRLGDGYLGWPDAAPFDAIVVAAAPPSVPAELGRQLTIGGRLIVPVGVAYQDLMVVTRVAVDQWTQRTIFPVRFVPMIHADDRLN